MSEGRPLAPKTKCSPMAEAQPSYIQVLEDFIEEKAKNPKGNLFLSSTPESQDSERYN